MNMSVESWKKEECHHCKLLKCCNGLDELRWKVDGIWEEHCHAFDPIRIYQCPQCKRLLFLPTIEDGKKKCVCGFVFGDLNVDLDPWEVKK